MLQLIVVWTWALYALRRFFKANLTHEIQHVLFIWITEVVPVIPNTFTVSQNIAVTTAELWWYLNIFSRNWNKSFSDLLFFSITVLVESWNLCGMQWELDINWFAASLIFCVHHSFYLTKHLYHQMLCLSSMVNLNYHQLCESENFLHRLID